MEIVFFLDMEQKRNIKKKIYLNIYQPWKGYYSRN